MRKLNILSSLMIFAGLGIAHASLLDTASSTLSSTNQVISDSKSIANTVGATDTAKNLQDASSTVSTAKQNVDKLNAAQNVSNQVTTPSVTKEQIKNQAKQKAADAASSAVGSLFE